MSCIGTSDDTIKMIMKIYQSKIKEALDISIDLKILESLIGKRI